MLIDQLGTTDRYDACMNHVGNNATLVSAAECDAMWDSTLAYPWPAKGPGETPALTFRRGML